MSISLKAFWALFWWIRVSVKEIKKKSLGCETGQDTCTVYHFSQWQIVVKIGSVLALLWSQNWKNSKWNFWFMENKENFQMKKILLNSNSIKIKFVHKFLIKLIIELLKQKSVHKFIITNLFYSIFIIKFSFPHVKNYLYIKGALQKYKNT